MVRQGARFGRWAMALLAMAAACTAAEGMRARADVVGGAGASRGRVAGEDRPHAAAGATTAELFLCIGPTASCPSTGVVSPTPPYQAMLAMQFGQTWNGTMDAYANDGSAITGTISLMDSYNGAAPQPLCTLSVAAGGTCPASVGTTVGTAVGTHVLTSVYSGDATHAGSVSASVTIVVSQETTTATLIGTPNPAIAGQPVTLTATIGGSYAAPSGTVTFMYNGVVIGTANLVGSNGAVSAAATMTTSTLPVGQDTITAVYTSTTDFTSATATWVVTITPAPAGDFTLSVTPNSLNIGVGYGALFTATVKPQNGFAQDVKLTCGNLPQEATCTFVNPTIAGRNGSTTLIVQTAAPHSCGTTTPYFLGRNGGSTFERGRSLGIGVFAAGFFVLMIPPHRRRLLKLLIALVALISVMQMSGCGNCTDLGTRPGTYMIEVTGTAADSSSTVSQAVAITLTL